MKGLRLAVLGSDLGLSNGGEVGPAHCQQGPPTAEAQRTERLWFRRISAPGPLGPTRGSQTEAEVDQI